MEEVTKYILAILVLIVGYFLGIYLKKLTADEQVIGRKYFRIIAIVSATLSLSGLMAGKDWMLFTFAFIAIVTSRSLK